MLFLSLHKCLPWCLKCYTFINLNEINAFTPFTIVLRIKPVQQYGRLRLVTMEMQKLYYSCNRNHWHYIGMPQ